MKKIGILLVLITMVLSCKNEVKSQTSEGNITTEDAQRTEKQSDGLTLLKGEFVYYNGAAVLQTRNEIYGIFITEKLEELDKKAGQYKKEPTDMVNVEVRGKITNTKDDKILWENKFEIIEILNVSAPNETENNIVKLAQ
ncbi:hypothetical protein [Changchengzhania lutea]|uniref:hypothetical protein n=1 Tax=Changchengzhania lutea TaxID=2049305 RepID=UPI00115CF60B|nr:hypothetical protein [Changchengzhania lutea]